jgi:serine/threonine-protein kinase
MAEPRDDLAFERTWHRLAVPADRLSGLALDATITSRTLAELSEAPGPAARVKRDALPRISIGEQGDGAAPSGELDPDLVVVGLLGEGGMGRVELARQRSLDRDVAVKRPRAGASDLDAAALGEEAVVTGHLEHPNIIPVHAFGRDHAGQPLMVMKRVEGVSWRDLIQDQDHPAWASREPSPAARLTWHLETLGQVANAVAFAHSRGVVHRDIKPDNVMIGDFGEVYLLDWGLATRAAEAPPPGAASLVGTPAYMAPEMVDGGACDPRTDVYLLGATLHEILTGRVRHPGSDLEAVLRAAFASEPVAYGDDVTPELAALANRATARDAGARPASAVDFRSELLESVRHRGSVALCAAADQQLREGRLDESRFAYQLALREWPDNRAATAGLDRCAAAAVRLEVARGNALAARAALAQMRSPPPDLESAVVAVEAERAAAEADHDRLRTLEHDVDPRVAAGARLASMVTLSVVGTAISAYALTLRYTGRMITHGKFIGFTAALVVSTAVAIAVFRRRLMVNAFNRRLMIWFLVLLTFLLVNRTTGLWLGNPIERQLAFDQLGMAGMLAAGAVFLFRWVWLCGAIIGTGALVSAVYPEWAFLSFCVGSSVAMVLAVALLWRDPS